MLGTTFRWADVNIYIKSLLLLIFIVTSNPFVLDRIEDIGFQLGLAIYLFVWILSLVTLFLIAFKKNSIIKIALSLPIILSTLVSLNYYIVTNEYLEFFQLEVMLNAANHFTDALSTFDGLWYGFLITMIGAISFFMPSKDELSIGSKYILSSLFSVCLLLIVILYLRSGEGTKGMPIQFTPISYLSVITKDKLLNPIPSEMPKVKIAHTHGVFDGDIIIVMDESIRGDFLDINSPNGLNTGLLNYKHNFVNFGIASSSTNCSDTSNLSLRRGVTRSNYIKDKDHNPTIWQFAKKAGYGTVYIDAQLNNGLLGNHMTSEELRFVDEFKQISNESQPIMYKDQLVVRELADLLNNNRRDFIYINKMGAHFPYEGKYPDEFRVFQPVMDKVEFNKSYPEPGELPHPKDYSNLMRIKFINSYKNALSWNMSTFFSAFFNVDKQEYLMFYTSDHGQTFHDNGREGYGTHCSIVETDPEEGVVPFMVFSNSSDTLERFKKAKKINYNKVSHFNIAPTIYAMMGYDLDLFSSHEATIFDDLPDDNQYFLSKYFVRFGAKPIWNTIDMDGRDSLVYWDKISRKLTLRASLDSD